MKAQDHRLCSRPVASSAAVARRMRATRRTGTAAELALLSQLKMLGFSPEIDAQVSAPKRTRADFVFRRERVAVFVDGCFWHCCPIHRTFPKKNRDWWQSKLEANVKRDNRATNALRRAGWSVLRVWEHEITASPKDVAMLISRRIHRRRSTNYESAR